MIALDTIKAATQAAKLALPPGKVNDAKPTAKPPALPPGKPTAWRTSAALILTGLSAPVVEWTSAAIMAAKPASASLPAVAK